MDTPTDFESTSGLSLEYLQTMNAQSQSQNLSTETYHPDLNASLLNTPFIPLESDYSVYSESIPLQSDYSVYSQSTSREELHSRIQILSEEQVNHLLEYIRAQEQPDFSTVPTDGLPEWFDEDEFLSFCASPFGTSLAPMTTSLPPMTTSLPVDSIALPTALLAPGTNDTMTCCHTRTESISMTP
ncbi:hypothetical protein M7I_2708 [Glarea lozoyensis 74030]|uniref:Uncharacterized protein n=1 Tax=Glarea lozoyensis (strain ATCC 74030 / MF5533) TaxID=1104152 RepID=H0EJI2_GLAL7|nr:hypothetical protein M7I_2708 [Glarea lozoyensis 74030]